MFDLFPHLTSSLSSPTFFGVCQALVVSMACSLLCQFLYELFYERRETGSQIQRSFVLLGPSITLVFITVQLSLPLSLGLLGALSIVRFRVPIKEPEEIGFLMILIACSISCATSAYNLAAALIGLMILMLIGRSLANGRLPFLTRFEGTLLVSFDGDRASGAAAELESLIVARRGRTKLEYVVDRDGRTTMSYAVRGRHKIDWSKLQSELDEKHRPLEFALMFSRSSAR